MSPRLDTRPDHRLVGTAWYHPSHGLAVVTDADEDTVSVTTSPNVSGDDVNGVLARAIVSRSTGSSGDLSIEMPTDSLVGNWSKAPRPGSVDLCLHLIANQKSCILLPTTLPERSWDVRSSEARDLSEKVCGEDDLSRIALPTHVSRIKTIVDRMLAIHVLRFDGEGYPVYRARMRDIDQEFGPGFFADHVMTDPQFPVDVMDKFMESCALVALVHSATSGNDIESCASLVASAIESRMEVHRSAIESLSQSVS